MKIKAIREKQNLSQQELARRAGLAQSCISVIESGQKSPTINTLRKIATALGVSVLDLLEDEVRPGLVGTCGRGGEEESEPAVREGAL